MVSDIDRGTILRLRQSGHIQKDISRITGLSRRTIEDTIRRFRETGTTKDRPRTGRPVTATTPTLVKRIRERIRSNPKRSLRKMAKEMNISERSVRRVVKTRMGLRPIKLQKTHALTDQMKATRLQRCRALLQRFTPADTSDILFTDEKLFNVEQTFNHQNDRIWSQSVKEASKKGRYVSRKGHPASVMVWAGVTATGKTPLIFVDQGVKVNSQNYLNDILVKEVLPWSRAHFAGRNWTFQQDSAPAHKAKVVQDWCKNNFPAMITSAEWPPYSPDLNPLDFSVWSVLESKACSTPHKTLDSLKRSLKKAWDELDVTYLSATVGDFHKRLRACVKEKGGLFEI